MDPLENNAKGTTVEFYLPKELLWVISQVQTQILIKHLQNLDLASTSKSQPNITISTKLKLKNLDQTKPESRPRMNFISTTKHQVYTSIKFAQASSLHKHQVYTSIQLTQHQVY